MGTGVPAEILHDGYLGSQTSFFKVSPGPAAPVTGWGLGDTPVKTTGQEGAFGVACTAVKLLEKGTEGDTAQSLCSPQARERV